MCRYMRKCKGLGEEAVMEKAADSAAAAAAGRKRKIGLEESQISTSSVQPKTRRLAVEVPEHSASPPENSGNSTCESVSSDHVLACCCSRNGSSEPANGSSKSVDLEEENAVTVEISATSAGDSLDNNERERTPLNEVQAESGELDSTARPGESYSRRRPMTEKMPSEVELEEFFAAAEKNLQKQFIDKYNYDIVKDEPLEGRYEWVQIQLKP